MLQGKETLVSINNASYYMVSNYGNVKSIDRTIVRKDGKKYLYKGQILKQQINNQGYSQISIVYDDGKYRTIHVHRLVAEYFVPNPNSLPEVNHKDENKQNNYDWNLEWCNRGYNINYGNRNNKVSNKLSKKVRCIETGITYKSLHEASKINNIGVNMIACCCNKQRNTTHGYHWEYV